jgi:HD superfamily phosphohydrolase
MKSTCINNDFRILFKVVALDLCLFEDCVRIGEFNLMPPYVVRDPIHGFVQLNSKEVAIINTFVFQRLRRIYQLALAYLVYPGARHTRFEHSIGTLHIASNIVSKLLDFRCIYKSSVEAVRIAALLHDLGHGPFSHISEYILKKNYSGKKTNIEEIHEEITTSLIKNSSELRKVLGSKLSNSVISILKDNNIKRDVVSGPLDSDKLDYILRDAYFAGVRYGNFDLYKILDSLIPIPTGISGRLGIKEEGIHAVEQLILAKHHMTTQVYRHKVRAITDAMIIRGIELSFPKCKEMNKLYTYKNDKSYLDNYIEWWDERIIEHLLVHGTIQSKELFGRLFKRNLFKRIHRCGIKQNKLENIQLRNKFLQLPDTERVKFEKEISKLDQLKCDPNYIILDIISIKNPTYRLPSSRISEDEIQFQMDNGMVKYIYEIEDSIMNLKNTEDKQQYIEVYAPCNRWRLLYDDEKDKLSDEVGKILYN